MMTRFSAILHRVAGRVADGMRRIVLRLGATRLLVAGGVAFAVLLLALSRPIFDQVRIAPKSARLPEVIAAPPPPVPPSSRSVGDTGPRPDAPRFTAFADIAFGERTRLRPKITLQMPYEPVDATAFRDARRLIRLHGVTGPRAEAVCSDKQGALWGCGRQARVGLYNQVRRRVVTCTVLSTQQSPGSAIPAEDLATCEADGRDLALDLIRAGWVRPGGLPSREEAAAMEEAREAGRGLWDGGWTITR